MILTSIPIFASPEPSQVEPMATAAFRTSSSPSLTPSTSIVYVISARLLVNHPLVPQILAHVVRKASFSVWVPTDTLINQRSHQEFQIQIEDRRAEPYHVALGHPRVLGQAFPQLPQVFEIGVAIQLGEGLVSGLNYPLRWGVGHLVHVEPDGLRQHVTFTIISSL
jgi:hypothetical protein